MRQIEARARKIMESELSLITQLAPAIHLRLFTLLYSPLKILENILLFFKSADHLIIYDYGHIIWTKVLTIPRILIRLN